MGHSCSKAFSRVFGSYEVRTLMLGLDAAGKSTILFRLKDQSDPNIIPTIGFNVETVKVKNVKFNFWDVGGQSKIRPLWRHYYTGTDVLIFVIDSSDSERIEEARQELARTINNPELQNVLLLVFANKQDIKGAMQVPEITESLQLNQFKNCTWFVHGACGRTGDGLYEGLSWVSHNIKSRRRR